MIRLRPASTDDRPFIEEMSYEAACWRPGEDHPPPERILADPKIAIYTQGWGRPGDAGVIAEEHGARVGAAWFRLFPEDDAGYGYVAADVPELSIAVAARGRGSGTGTRLLEALVAEAYAQDFRALSLSVEPDNPALRLYERAGFVPFRRVGGATTMLLELRRP